MGSKGWQIRQGGPGADTSFGAASTAVKARIWHGADGDRACVARRGSGRSAAAVPTAWLGRLTRPGEALIAARLAVGQRFGQGAAADAIGAVSAHSTRTDDLERCTTFKARKNC